MRADQIIGYYTLAAGAIAVTEVPGRVRRNLLDPIPMAVLGRFAVDQAWQGRGLGRLLLRDALLRTCQSGGDRSRAWQFWYMRCRPRRDAFMMATAVANRQKTRGRFSSR